MSNMIEMLERNELIQKLVDNGQSELVNALLFHEQKAYTRKSRLNKSSACRILGWKVKQLENALAECRRILGEDVR